MKKNSIFLLLFLIICSLSLYASDAVPAVNKDEAYRLLKEGNERFFSGKRTFSHMDEARMKDVADNGQKPFATVLTCSDSRVPVEHIFDAGIGDIFTVRVAGNVCDTDEIGTIEYGVEHLKTPVLVIMGHTKCGAVTAVAENTKLEGSIPFLVDNIKPAVERIKAKNPQLSGNELIDKCVTENVWVSIEDLFKKSPLTCELVKKGDLLVIGAVYDLDSGKVTWLGQHPEEKKLINKSE